MPMVLEKATQFKTILDAELDYCPTQKADLEAATKGLTDFMAKPNWEQIAAQVYKDSQKDFETALDDLINIWIATYYGLEDRGAYERAGKRFGEIIILLQLNAPKEESLPEIDKFMALS